MEYEWAKEMNCAVTVCDNEGIILFMNDKSRATFAKHGDMVGQNLFGCHPPKAQEKIKELLATGGSNSYTIQKKEVRKLIYQTAWFKEGVVAGLVELSMVIGEDMPHFVRE